MISSALSHDRNTDDEIILKVSLKQKIRNHLNSIKYWRSKMYAFYKIIKTGILHNDVLTKVQRR